MFAIFVAAVTVSVFVMYFRYERRRMRMLPRSGARPIGELPEDTRGRVVGTVELVDAAGAHGEPLTAPLSGRSCVYYRVQLERAAPATADAPETWLPAASETRSVAFMLADPTGRALIEATAAKVELADEPPVPLAEPAAQTADQRAFLARHRIEASRLRYRETVIAPGDRIGVFGSGVREPDPDAAPADYRGEGPTRLRLTSSARHPLFITAEAAPQTAGRADS